jgi:hypothetical protein
MPMTLEVIERRVYHVADHQVAADLRLALAAHDLERLDELITFLDIDTPQTAKVLDYREVA